VRFVKHLKLYSLASVFTCGCGERFEILVLTDLLTSWPPVSHPGGVKSNRMTFISTRGARLISAESPSNRTFVKFFALFQFLDLDLSTWMDIQLNIHTLNKCFCHATASQLNYRLQITNYKLQVTNYNSNIGLNNIWHLHWGERTQRIYIHISIQTKPPKGGGACPYHHHYLLIGIRTVVVGLLKD